MNAESLPPLRVLLVLDACAARAGLLEKAAQLASALGSELSVRYLEDERLLQSASLPFTREIMAVTSSLRAMNLEALNLSYRSETAQIKNRLRVLARERGIRWTFESSREKLPGIQPGSDGDDDIILMEAKHYDHLVSTSSSVFISMASHCRMCHVVVLFDGSPDTQRCLATAARLADYYNSSLHILIPPLTEPQYSRSIQEIEAMHRGSGKTLVTRITGIGCAEIGKAVRWRQGGLLVMSSTIQPDRRTLKELINSLQMQVLVIKGKVSSQRG